MRFPVQVEKETQVAIEQKLAKSGVAFFREHRLSTKDIPDFFLPEIGVVIEVKIKGRSVDIYAQCERYCQYDQVRGLILITNKIMGFPPQISARPVYVINMGKAWL